MRFQIINPVAIATSVLVSLRGISLELSFGTEAERQKIRIRMILSGMFSLSFVHQMLLLFIAGDCS